MAPVHNPAVVIRCLILCVLAAGTSPQDPAVDGAIKLYYNHDYSEAGKALEKIISRDPGNAKACYYLGMSIRHRGDQRARDDALVWLEKAVSLAPENSAYEADYGGTCLELADRHRSYDLATGGRDAMEKAIHLDPGNLDARDGLLQFYARAPWPLGDRDRAFAQADEIGHRDPGYGVRAFLWLGRYFEKKNDRASARKAYRGASALDPRNLAALQALARLK